MVKKTRTFFLSLTILAFLLFSTVGTTTVFADDGTGTEPTATETAPPTEEERPAKPVVEETPTPGEETQPTEPVVEETPPAGEETQPMEETAPAETIVTILEQVPDNTTVTVLNSEGEALPLASQETADAIASDYDPIWCPAGQVPTPGANGCTPSFDSFDELLAYLQANEASYSAVGTIYIQQGDYLGGETSIDFNNYQFDTFDQYALTLQGGWDTTYDPANGDPTFTTTNFNVPIIIGSSSNPWAGSLTLNNINISGVSSQAGLTLYSAGDISVDQVNVTDSQSAADINAVGDVIVKNSKFNDNGSGLRIDAGDDASLINVEAMNNSLYGVHIKAKNVAIDTANFSGNGSGNALNLTGYGLQVISDLNVAIIRVTANNNQLYGADISATGAVAIAQSYFNGQITYYRDNGSGEILERNGGYGLKVVTLGPIALEDVTATGNYLYGAYLKGGRTTVQDNPATIGGSTFTGNGSGISTDPVGYGLMIESSNTVTLIGVDASNNQYFGADIKAELKVTITDSFFSGHQSVLPPGVDNVFCSTYQVEVADWVDFDFCGYGLKVVTPDDIDLTNVKGNSNNLWGASLTGKDIKVYDSQFNNNVTESTAFIDDTGMFIFASGYVDITRTEAKENRLYGAKIVAEGPVFITNSFFTGNQGFICITPWCDEEGREYFGVGLDVTTPDYILVQGADVSNNNLFGALLNGSQIDIENSTFNNNGMGDGLIVNATDNVTLTNVTALKNGGDGVEVDGVCQKVVQVTSGNFSNNTLYGLKVLDATLNIDGTQTFADNGSGNVFTDTSTCVVVIPTIVITSLNTESAPLASPTVITNSVEVAVDLLPDATNPAGEQPVLLNAVGTSNEQTPSETIVNQKADKKKEVQVSNLAKKTHKKGLYKKFWWWPMLKYQHALR